MSIKNQREGMFLCMEHQRRTVLFLVPAEGMNMDVVAEVMQTHNKTHQEKSDGGTGVV